MTLTLHEAAPSQQLTERKGTWDGLNGSTYDYSSFKDTGITAGRNEGQDVIMWQTG